jgi:hypothetical protein
MRESLQNWINDASNLHYLKYFDIPQIPIALAHVTNRAVDYYISLVGELFERINDTNTPNGDWLRIANALLQIASECSVEQLLARGISKDETMLYAAAAFYFGDYPASACLVMRSSTRPNEADALRAGCYDFLARPAELTSEFAIEAKEALRTGVKQRLDTLVQSVSDIEKDSISNSPSEWVAAKLLRRLLVDFCAVNIRAVLPGGYDPFWNPLVNSLIRRQPSAWEFFPSQIKAITDGLLLSDESFSLQMPTGAGKTTLCEALLYTYTLTHENDVAIMLVPYRSLASELRGSLVRRLNVIGIASRSAYGGTVPQGDELHALDDVKVLVATPESLSGLIAADGDFARRIGLVVCDEGHLLDSDGRGIALELLLSRLRSRTDRRTRFVFISAIVPNIEEINAWLGGSSNSVVRSEYQPAIAEYGLLQPEGNGVNRVIRLLMSPQLPVESRFKIDGFLDRQSFIYINPATGNPNTYGFGSIKVQAVAAARKVLPMGAVAVFAANKRGNQGAIGVAESLIGQLSAELNLPKPIDYVKHDVLHSAIEYLDSEYGPGWIGSQCVRNGIILHHGDIPQETREVLEGLIRCKSVNFVICTNTLAEGVNLPIRTLVLYSVKRQQGAGPAQSMLARDIKNLVGRAGRAGANTRGLVICANPEQWELVRPVALQGEGESVNGSLVKLIRLMTSFIASRNIDLSNEFLEANSIIHPLIDGVDATLIELISNEIGAEDFIARATRLAEQTYAAQQLEASSVENLRTVFQLRARRIIDLRDTGKIVWVRETGAKVRLIESVEQGLLPLLEAWAENVDPLSAVVVDNLLQWAWGHSELKKDIRSCFRLGDNDDVEAVRGQFFDGCRLWLSGQKFVQIAQSVNIPMDDLLNIYTRGVSFSLQTLLEQGISLMSKRVQAEGRELPDGVLHFPEHLRFGVPNYQARVLAASGLRHRSACVQLGHALQAINMIGDKEDTKRSALESLRQHSDAWRPELGELIYQQTLQELSRA